jgi:2-methylisocitrate lyase-like PEP mutase family enzyme
LHNLEQLQQVTEQIDKPFNVLAPFFHDVSTDDLATAGAKRISVGGALTWTAVSSILSASKEMLEQGTFNWTEKITSGKEIKQLMS